MNWLLLRGLSREARHWGRFLDVLSGAMPSARLFTLDLPGTGTENARPSPLDIRGITDDLRARWRAVAAREEGPWAIYAVSLGGMVAMDWCARHPGDFSRAVLASTSSADVGSPLRRFSIGSIGGVLRAAFARDPVARERVVLDMVARIVPDPDEVARAWAAIHADRPVSARNVAAQMRAASRFASPAQIDVPLLVLVGLGDQMVDPVCSTKLAAKYGARFAAHPTGGHDLAVDAPEWVADEIAEWLAK